MALRIADLSARTNPSPASAERDLMELLAQHTRGLHEVFDLATLMPDLDGAKRRVWAQIVNTVGAYER